MVERMGSTSTYQEDKADKEGEEEDNEVLDMDQLLDFEVIPKLLKGKDKDEQLKFWKGRASKLKKCCEKLLKRRSKSGGGEGDVVEPVDNLNHININSAVTQRINLEVGVEPEVDVAPAPAVQLNGHHVENGEDGNETGTGSIDMFDDFDIAVVLPPSDLEDVDGNNENVPPIENEEEVDDDDDEEAAPGEQVSPSATVYIPRGKRRVLNSKSKVVDDEEENKDHEEAESPPSPAATVFVPRKRNLSTSTVSSDASSGKSKTTTDKKKSEESLANNVKVKKENKLSKVVERLVSATEDEEEEVQVKTPVNKVLKKEKGNEVEEEEEQDKIATPLKTPEKNAPHSDFTDFIPSSTVKKREAKPNTRNSTPIKSKKQIIPTDEIEIIGDSSDDNDDSKVEKLQPTKKNLRKVAPNEDHEDVSSGSTIDPTAEKEDKKAVSKSKNKQITDKKTKKDASVVIFTSDESDDPDHDFVNKRVKTEADQKSMKISSPNDNSGKSSTTIKKDASSDNSSDEVDASIPVKLIVDKEKPSTSKRVVAELARQKRRRDMSNKKKTGPGSTTSSTRKKLTKDAATARRAILDSSTDDEGPSVSPSRPIRKKPKSSPKKEKSLPESQGPITPQDRENDINLSKKMKAVVVLNKLASAIEEELIQKKFIICKDNDTNKSDEEDEDVESDSSIVKLDRAIKELTRFNAKITRRRRDRVQTSKTKSPLKKASQKKKNNAIVSDSDDKDVVIGESSAPSPASDTGRPTIKLASLKNILDQDLLSDLEDLSEDESPEKSKKNKKEKEKHSAKSAAKKKYVTPQIDFSSDESGQGDRKDVLSNEDSDTDTKRSKRKNKSASDSDVPLVRKRATRSKKVKQHLDSDASSNEDKKKTKSDNDYADDSDVKSDSKSESEEDSDFVDEKKTKKKGKGKRGHSSPDDDDDDDDKSNKKKSKKRKRIKEEKDSDASSSIKSDDSDVQALDDVPASQRRKKINKIMDDSKLKKSTREAEKEEEERKRRVADKQKLFNGVFDQALVEDGKVKRLVLEYDHITKEPLIEVDESIVTKLKPHQEKGIRFMYTTCFESVEQIKNGPGGGCILAHCMGLGKTLQTVAFTQTMLAHSELTTVKSVLIVCPLNTVGNWYKEYQLWLDDVETKDKPKLHRLWEGKTIVERVSDLSVWKRRGGVGIMHYDFFRVLVNNASGTNAARTKVRVKPAQRDVIREALLDPGPDIVVCDEGHLLKNHKSKLSEALSKIKTIRRIVLTGTPLQNNLVEYHTMVNFVKPNLLGSLKEFTNRFVNPIKNGQCKDSSERDVKVMKRRAHVLHSKLDGCVQRLDYSVLTPYLPPKHEYCIIIKLSDKQKDLYRDYLAKEVSDDPLERSRKLLVHYSVLVKILAHPIVLTFMKEKNDDKATDSDEEGSLKDFICDDESGSGATTPLEESDSDIECLDGKKKAPTRKTRSNKDVELINPEDNPEPGMKQGLGKAWWCSHFDKKEDMYDTNLSGKLIVLQQILKTCETVGDRVLVFSQYLTTLNIIEQFLLEWDKAAVEEQKADKDRPPTINDQLKIKEGRWRDGIEYFRIDGQTKTNDRQKHCDTFNKKNASTKAKLFLISTKAGGLGINLFGANRVVIFDASWNPSNDMQSIFRVYRFGQQKPCYIYRFVAEATMEEKIYNRQVVKLSLSSRVIDEHQVERHFKFDDINEMYRYAPEEKSERPTPPVPKDRLLADILISHKDWIETYFEHDTLLINKEDETLTEEERRQAWDEYQNEGRVAPAPDILAGDQVTYRKIILKLRERFPDASDQQINASALIVLTKIQELRVLVQKLNFEGMNMTDPARRALEDKIKRIQAWISQALGGTPLDQTSYYNIVQQQQPRQPRPAPTFDPVQMANIQQQMLQTMAMQRVVNVRLPPASRHRTYPNMNNGQLPNPRFQFRNAAPVPQTRLRLPRNVPVPMEVDGAQGEPDTVDLD